MEFTKENVIKLLTDAQDLLVKLSKNNKEQFEEFKEIKGLKEYHEGKMQAFDLVSEYLGDIINWINAFMLETNDYIDKENK